jgi:toxin ParE1/3/4
MRVVISEAAYADLLDIGRAIARDSPGRAFSFVDELHERCKGLSTMAQAFPLLPGWEERGVRRRPFGDYLIFYRISVREVQVLRVLHGARDYERVLFPDE